MMEVLPPIRPFVWPAGHSCSVSTGICERLTFGTGKLNDYGYWEHGCPECAHECEKQFPEWGPCWPSS